MGEQRKQSDGFVKHRVSIYIHLNKRVNYTNECNDDEDEGFVDLDIVTNKRFYVVFICGIKLQQIKKVNFSVSNSY